MVPSSHFKKSKNGKYTAINGVFKPRHPEKLSNSNKNPKFKSRLELLGFNFMDRSENIIQWDYEPFGLWYIDQSSRNSEGKRGKKRRYFIDIVCTIKKKDGTIKKALIEIKHSKDLKKPIASKRKSQRNQRLDENAYLKNRCKWSAAKTYCDKMGYEFIILTEQHLK